jgi:hypothetical protein
MSDFVDVGTYDKNSKTKIVSFSYRGSPQQLAQFHQEVRALAEKYGLKAVSGSSGGGGSKTGA